MEHTQPDFTGQHVFTGLDVALRAWKVCVLVGESYHRRFSMEPDPAGLVRYLRRHFPGAIYHCVYEAGYCGFWIYDELTRLRADCIVVNPADVPTSDKERRTKTDHVDAGKLARHLRSGELHGIYIPPPWCREDRTLVRTRAQCVRKQTRCKNQIKSLMFLYGLPVPDAGSSWSRNFIRSLEALRFERDSGNLALKAYLTELMQLRQIIAQLNRDLRTLSRTDEYREGVQLLKSVPGISTLSAMVFLTELGELSRFASFDKLCGYVGLTPDTHGSGEKQGIGDITRRCNQMLRSLLIECSWTALRKDPALALAYHCYCQRTRKTKAVVKIARKLLNRIRFVLNNRHPYVLKVA